MQIIRTRKKMTLHKKTFTFVKSFYHYIFYLANVAGHKTCGEQVEPLNFMFPTGKIIFYNWKHIFSQLGPFSGLIDNTPHSCPFTHHFHIYIL